MFLTCDQCQTRYKIDAAKLAGGGRMVRCTKCAHTWFFTPQETVETSARRSDLSDAQRHEAADIAGDLPQESDFESSVESFHDMLAQRQVEESVPSVVRPAAETEMPVLDHRPGGLGANAFGLCVFLLLLFPSLLALFIFRGAIAEAVPAMTALYKPLGIAVKAPGEGLRFSSLIARARGEGEEQALDLSMKLSNISDKPLHYPSVKVTLFGVYGAALKDWEFHPEEKELAPGETIPVQLSFDDMPADGKTVEVRVTGH